MKKITEKQYYSAVKKLDRKVIDKLQELYERDHGNCDSTTCDMHQAFTAGYTLYACSLFYGSGASDDEFNTLFEQLPKQALKTVTIYESDSFINDPDCKSMECEYCHAHIYGYEFMGNMAYCSSCGEETKVDWFVTNN
jgi:hypothetical protein